MNRYALMMKLLFLHSRHKRAEYLKKIGYFHQQGDNCYFQPINFGTEPHLISFGDNVYIAANVHFITHDVIAHMLRIKLHSDTIEERVGKIIIHNNVFIGSGSDLMYDIEIGSDVIVAAGSLVTKNLPGGMVYAGRPCKAMGTFEDYERRMLEWSKQVPWDHRKLSMDRIHEMQEISLWSDTPPSFPRLQ